jgi:hypothetical protein
MRFLAVVLVVVGCISPQLSDNQAVIQQIIKDESIPLETKNRLVQKLWEEDMKGINVVHKRNQALSKEAEKNAWKVSFVNTLIWIAISIFAGLLTYFFFRFRKLFGFPF